MNHCPCGETKPFSECCGQYIEKGLAAPTPEALMRSRYSAFVVGNLEYLSQTMKGKAAKEFDMDETKLWLTNVIWLSLTVTSTKIKTPKIGFVTFEARYQANGQLHVMREKSEFHFDEGHWYYVAGKALNPHIGTK